MAAKMSVLGLILSSYLYLRSAMVRFPFHQKPCFHQKQYLHQIAIFWPKNMFSTITMILLKAMFSLRAIFSPKPCFHQKPCFHKSPNSQKWFKMVFLVINSMGGPIYQVQPGSCFKVLVDSEGDNRYLHIAVNPKHCDIHA